MRFIRKSVAGTRIIHADQYAVRGQLALHVALELIDYPYQPRLCNLLQTLS